MADLVKRLNEDFSVNAREDIQHQMKVYEAERKEAADRIEALEAALRHCAFAIKEWERKPEGIDGFLLGAMDNAFKMLGDKRYE